MTQTTDIAVRQVVSPATGQVVSLDAATEDLAAYLVDQRELEVKLRYVKDKVGEELLGRMDKSRRWTLREGEYEASAPSDAPELKWDTDRLALLLTQLVDEGRIDAAAMDAALEQVVTWKVKAAGINALKKNPALAEAIDGCSEPTEKRRYVKVRRLRP